jgi:hypothetical protein
MHVREQQLAAGRHAIRFRTTAPPGAAPVATEDALVPDGWPSICHRIYRPLSLPLAGVVLLLHLRQIYGEASPLTGERPLDRGPVRLLLVWIHHIKENLTI